MLKKTDWDDESVVVKTATDYKERKFELVAGQKEIIRIIGKPVVFKRYYLKEKNIYIIPQDGDDILDQKGFDGKRTWAVKVLHIASVKAKKIRKVGMLKVWLFSDASKFVTLRELKESYGEFKNYEIALTCTDTKFQKIGAMNAILKSSNWLCEDSMLDDVKENKELLEQMIITKSKKQIEEILEDTSDDDMGLSEDDDMDAEDKKVKPKKKPSEDEDDEEEVDEDDEEEVDEDDDKPKKKSKKKDDDESEKDDEDEDDVDDEVVTKTKKQKKLSEDEDEDEDDDKPKKKSKKKDDDDESIDQEIDDLLEE